MIGISLKTIGLKTVLKKLSRHADKIKNKRRTLYARLAVLGFKDIQSHFRNEMGPQGSWEKLSKITLARRRKEGKGAKILQDLGNLKNSVMPNTGQRLIRRDSVIISTGGTEKRKVDTYAAVHNFGLHGMPEREFMYISEDGKLKIKEQVNKFIKWL